MAHGPGEHGGPVPASPPETSEGLNLGVVRNTGLRWQATIASQHGRRDYWRRRMLAVADMLSLAGALLVAFVASQRGEAELVWLLPLLPAWVALFGLYGLYGRDVKRIRQGALDELPSLFHALVLGSLGLWVSYRLLPVDQLVLMEMLVFGAAGLAFVLTSRWLTRHVVTGAFGPERVLLVGRAPVTEALIRKMRMHPEYALEPIAIISRGGTPVAGERGSPPRGVDLSLPTLGDLANTDLPDLLRRHDVERVIVAQEEVDDALMLDLFRECGRIQVKVSVLPRSVETMGPSMEVDDIEGVTVLGLNPLVLSRYSQILKRAMDLLGASLGLLLFSPVMVLAAIAIKLDSPGPVFFRQARIGRGGESFSLLKLRTMVPEAEAQKRDLMCESEERHWLKLERDPRITRVGRVLRRLSLDELPQLWNVLTGSMSLVGPRPLIPEDHEQIEEWASVRLDLSPGITGLWQVLGRTNIPFEEMIKLDCAYVTNWSLMLDLTLLLRTVPIVVSRRGAN